MKKSLIVTFGLMLCLALAMPAMADVSAQATIEKHKDIYIWECVGIEKHVDVCVDVELETSAAAEAQALVNQVNAFGAEASLGFDCGDPYSAMTDSIKGNTGIVGVNQASGALTNQGNVVAVAATTGKKAFADAQAAVDQANALAVAVELLNVSADVMTGSIVGNAGIVGVNQTAGSLNNQANTVALSAGLEGSYVSLAEADLGQQNTCTLVIDLATTRLDMICSSIVGNHGVVGVNQSAGNLNNQANLVSISFAH